MTNLLDKMPRSYDELHYKKYFKIMTSLPAEQPEHMDKEEWDRFITFTILSILLDTPIIDLENLPAYQLLQLIDITQFFSKYPKTSKKTIKIKDIKSLTYDDFVNYTKLKEQPFENIGEILKIMVLDKTPDEIENFTASQAYEVFFSLNKTTEKLQRRFMISLGVAALKEAMKIIWKKITGVFKNKTSKV